jgi:hypothetical protein
VVRSLLVNFAKPRQIQLRGCQPRDLISQVISLADASASRQLSTSTRSGMCRLRRRRSWPPASCVVAETALSSAGALVCRRGLHRRLTRLKGPSASVLVLPMLSAALHRRVMVLTLLLARRGAHPGALRDRRSASYVITRTRHSPRTVRIILGCAFAVCPAGPGPFHVDQRLLDIDRWAAMPRSGWTTTRSSAGRSGRGVRTLGHEARDKVVLDRSVVDAAEVNSV